MFSSSATPETAKKFKYWQIRTMLVTWTAYAVVFMMRKILSVALPGIESELHISKAQLGIFMTLNGVIYGISRFANGFIVHKFMARNFLACCLVLCAICGFVFGFSSTVLVMGLLWVLQGWFQGMSWPPNARLLSYWIPPRELATKMSLWTTSNCIGAVVLLIVGTRLALLSWRNIFFVFSTLGIITAAVVWFFIRDTPSSVGLPELSVGENHEGAKNKKEQSAEYKSFIKKQVFKNPYIWIIGISNFSVYIFRFAILDWGPTLLKQWQGSSLTNAGLVVAAFEMAGALGMIVWGRVADKYFKGKCSRVCAITMTLASFFMFMFWFTMKVSIWASLATLVSAGFCMYGAQSLILVAAANIATKRAASVASGFVGIWGYSATVVTGVCLGSMIQKYGWDRAFKFIVILGFIGTVLLFFAWKAKATGYEELEVKSK